MVFYRIINYLFNWGFGYRTKITDPHLFQLLWLYIIVFPTVCFFKVCLAVSFRFLSTVYNYYARLKNSSDLGHPYYTYRYSVLGYIKFRFKKYNLRCGNTNSKCSLCDNTSILTAYNWVCVCFRLTRLKECSTRSVTMCCASELHPRWTPQRLSATRAP